jgi:hypothetical protein
LKKGGLSSWNAYKYNGYQGTCIKDSYITISNIKNYVRISQSNQEILKKFVRIGPVSVGMCGTDSSFLFYTGTNYIFYDLYFFQLIKYLNHIY